MTESLREQLLQKTDRETLVSEATQILEAEVQDKSGLGGLAIKGAFKLLGSAKPGFARRAVSHLLDEFLDALDPFYQAAHQAGEPGGKRLRSQPEAVAKALLTIADGRVARSDNEAARKAYGKLRPTAEKHVAQAVPRLADLVERHTKG